MAFLNFTKPALLDQEYPDLPWHLPTATVQKLHLHPTGTLTPTAPLSTTTIEYQADSPSELTFTYTFPSKTILTGPSTVVLSIAAQDHNDLDIHAHIFKASASGTMLSHLNIPIPANTPSEVAEKMTQNRVWRYLGPSGMLRASKRHVADALRGKTWETLSMEREDKVAPGEVVRLRVQLWPTGMVFEAGEMMVLKISGREMGLRDLPGAAEMANENVGKHVIHIGGEMEGYLEFFTL